MRQLTDRQKTILQFISTHESVSNRDIVGHLSKTSRATIVRDLDALLKERLITKEGKGRSVLYHERGAHPLLRFFDVEVYFQTPPDERNITHERFNFDVFKNLADLFTVYEVETLVALNMKYQERIKKLSQTILKKEFERLMIELSWKSSRIEGNTYSLLDTELLIKENKEAKGHTHEEALMILNHKNAMEYVRDKKNNFQKLTLTNVENLHRIIVDKLGIAHGLRKKPVGIVGTKYRPFDNEHQIKEAMEKMLKSINELQDPFSKAFSAIALLSYIQPFEDGNKRTSRLLGDAILLAYDVCPLSFRSVDEGDYKKAMILFYEQNSLRFFKELFIQQFKFAVNNYFRV